MSSNWNSYNYNKNNSSPKKPASKKSPFDAGAGAPLGGQSNKEIEILREAQLIFTLFPKGSHIRKAAEKKIKN